MSGEKIKVSLDEVYSTRTDDKMKSQDALARAASHYQQQVLASKPMIASPAQGASRTSIWYNSIFHMAVFGLLGGLVAWGASEILEQAYVIPHEEFRKILRKGMEIDAAAEAGEITRQKAREMERSLELQYADNPYVRIGADEGLSSAQKEMAIERQMLKDKKSMFIKMMIWMGLIGATIATFLSIAEHAVGRNWRSVGINSSVGVFLGAFGGIIVSLFINDLYHAMGGGDPKTGTGQQMVARSIGWAILGLFLAVAPGIVMRSGKRLLIGLAGGLIGGFLGGLLFDPIGRIAEGTGGLSRAIAITAIGLLAAIGTGIIEKAAKTGWVKVIAGLITGKQFILYRNPTNIGSSPQCEIYLFKDTAISPRHAAIHAVHGGFEIENCDPAGGTFVNGQAVTRKKLSNGDRIQVGSTVLDFQEKKKL